jgi:VanZ family protein
MTVALVIVAIGLEALQLAIPGRHGRVVDAMVKCAGVIAGMAAVALTARAASNRSP